MNGEQDGILIVEDDPDDRALLARAFRRIEVAAPLAFAEDGEQAIAALSAIEAGREARPRVVLLDLKLPRRSGFEVLAWIKGREVFRRTPVVILTSSRENVDLVRAYDLGANSYLVKPARPEALLALVRQIDAYWLGLNELAWGRE